MMVQIYRHRWRKNIFRSLLEYIRDCFVLLLPVKRLPRSWVRILYGVDARFAFLVHPRFYQDVFVSAPFLSPFKFIFRKKTSYGILAHLAPFVLNRVTTEQGVHGFVIGYTILPEVMFGHRKLVINKIRKALKLVSKICLPNAVVGLGGWYPMISKRGAIFEDDAKALNIQITNGHCGTLASIYMTIERIAGIGDLKIDELNVAIVGVGKMGTNVVKALNGKVKKLYLIDIAKSNLKRAEDFVKNHKCGTDVESILSNEDHASIKEALTDCHLGVFATSSFRNVLKLKDMPNGFIAIDDARPEALPRDPRNERIVLEGGLLKIAGAQIDYNYGFGLDDNVFGCLGEAFLLALCDVDYLKATIGDVDMDNFYRVLEFCQRNNVVAGDLKSSDYSVTDSDIQLAFERRGLIKTR